MMDRKHMLKIIILGDMNVGKTSIMKKYVNNQFSETYKATIGADFLTKNITLDNDNFILQIWDTAGQERFQSLGTAFYRGTDICILVYDSTNLDSLYNLINWKKEFITNSGILFPEKYPFLVIGNKKDLPNNISNEIIENVMKKMDIKLHFKVSAKNGENLNKAFKRIIFKSVDQDIDYYNVGYNFMNDVEPENIILESKIKKKSCCGV